ncbi:MAG: hypothetical protein FWC09_01830 [Lachnospiraceae bacterium]|nr:hypothetical protein [Lachnospiraceae bacterium]
MEAEKKIKIPKLKIFIVLFILALIIFGVYNIMWFNYVKIFDTLVNNEKLQEIKEKPSLAPEFMTFDGVEFPYSYERYIFMEWDGWEGHAFRDYDYNERGYYYGIVVPPYLTFGGNIQTTYTTDVYDIDLIISPKSWLYVLRLGEFTEDNNHKSIHSYGSAVDRNGNPLDKHPDDIDEWYQEWLRLYEKYQDQIMELFVVLKETYGDTLQ